MREVSIWAWEVMQETLTQHQAAQPRRLPSRLGGPGWCSHSQRRPAAHRRAHHVSPCRQPGPPVEDGLCQVAPLGRGGGGAWPGLSSGCGSLAQQEAQRIAGHTDSGFILATAVKTQSAEPTAFPQTSPPVIFKELQVWGTNHAISHITYAIFPPREEGKVALTKVQAPAPHAPRTPVPGCHLTPGSF